MLMRRDTPPVSTMRLLLSAAVLLLLAACDSYGVDTPVPTPVPTVIDTLGTVRVAPHATYLRTEQDPGATSTAALPLDSLGVAPGDALTFYVTGYVDLQPGTVPAARSRDLVGVFAASPALAAPDALARVTGALDAGADFVTDSTAVGRVATDVPQDFFATRATVTVPAGATHLFLAVHDVFYSDNADVGEGVSVTLLRRRP